MGVSGSGKTAVGERLAKELGVPFFEGDDFHPKANVEKMSSGVPLDEFSAADRQAVINAIRYGVGGMPASADGMSDEQIDALADYVAGLRR